MRKSQLIVIEGFNLYSSMYILNICFEITLGWMPQDLTDE